MAYSVKAWLCGNVIEIYSYDKLVYDSYSLDDCEKRGRSVVACDDDKLKNRKKVCQRAKIDLIRLINTNYKVNSSRFVTLTFRENMQDLKKANYEFKKFILRFEYYLGYKLQYTAVVEFQQRGAVHYHVIFYNISAKLDLPRCTEIWGHGSFNCKRIDKVKNVGVYMVKYLLKNSQDERFVGQKMYFNSRGLKKPQEIKEPDLIAQLQKSLLNQAPNYVSEYDIVFNDKVQNHVVYKQYIISEA